MQISHFKIIEIYNNKFANLKNYKTQKFSKKSKILFFNFKIDENTLI